MLELSLRLRLALLIAISPFLLVAITFYTVMGTIIFFLGYTRGDKFKDTMGAEMFICLLELFTDTIKAIRRCQK